MERRLGPVPQNRSSRTESQDPTQTVLEAVARYALRQALKEAVAARTRYVNSSGFVWSELMSDVTRCLGCPAMPVEEFRRRIPVSIEQLAQRLLDAWKNNINPERHHMIGRDDVGMIFITPRNSPAPVATKLPARRRSGRGLPRAANQERTKIAHIVREKLVDALGDLYGGGKRASFILNSGKIGWDIIGPVCGASGSLAKLIAGQSCAEVLREIEDYVLSHRDQIERWIHERRLGLPTEPPTGG